MAEYKGIDVSRYQSTIDWKKVKADGVQFAMLRCGTGYNGGSKDTKFEQNYKNAREQGIFLGAYYYTYAKTVERAKKDADLVIEWLKGKKFEYPIVFDIEDKTQANLGKAKISAIIKAFCEKVEKAGYYVMVYANKDWLENRIDEDVKTKYDTWLAQWTEKPTYKGNYGIWQYTSKGKVNGISGNVDMDISYKNYPAIMKANGLNGYTKNTAQTVKPPVTKPVVKTIEKGEKVIFKDKPTYTTSTSKKAKKRTGTFYVYDGVKVNGRYRITNSANRVGEKPIWLNVTCWAEL